MAVKDALILVIPFHAFNITDLPLWPYGKSIVWNGTCEQKGSLVNIQWHSIGKSPRGW